METEEQLLKAVKSGDRQAMRRLYERYKGYAMSIGLRYIPDSDDVEDVVQDSFVKILTSVQHIDYQGEGSLTAWVRKTVVNKALDFVRRLGIKENSSTSQLARAKQMLTKMMKDYIKRHEI